MDGFKRGERGRKPCESIILRQEGCKHLCRTGSGIGLDRKHFETLRRLLFLLELHLFRLLLSSSTLPIASIQGEASSDGRETPLLVEFINEGWPDASKWYRKP